MFKHQNVFFNEAYYRKQVGKNYVSQKWVN